MIEEKIRDLSVDKLDKLINENMNDFNQTFRDWYKDWKYAETLYVFETEQGLRMARLWHYCGYMSLSDRFTSEILYGIDHEKRFFSTKP